MTFTLSLPMVLATCAFVVPVAIGGIGAIKSKDVFFVVIGAMIGALFGAAVFGVGKVIEGSTVSRAAIQTAYAKQCSHYDTMPEDWQHLYEFLKTVETVPLRQVYVKDFLKNKSEPEISAKAYEVFFQTTDCSRYTSAYCLKWKHWLGQELAPYASIDVHSALESVTP